MKSLKFLTVGIALLLSIALSSCDTKQEAPATWAGIVRANLDGSYTDTAGTKLLPTVLSNKTSMSMAYIYCQINEQQPAQAKSRSITLLADPIGIDAESWSAESIGSADDRPNNAAIFTLAVNTGYYQLTPILFDKNTLVLPVAFSLRNDVTNASLTDELAKHQFDVVYYLNSTTSGDTDMDVYLRHAVSDPETLRKEQRTWTYKAYDIGKMLTAFSATSGNAKPSRIIIHTQENSSSDKLDDAKDETYPVDYTPSK